MGISNDKENLLKKWMEFREEEMCFIKEEEKQYLVNYDKLKKKILEKECTDTSRLIEDIYNNLMEYGYSLNEKYYMLGFKDAINLILSIFK